MSAHIIVTLIFILASGHSIDALIPYQFINKSRINYSFMSSEKNVHTSTVDQPTVIICPGNGCTNVMRSNWYGRLHAELTRKGILCECKNFPDSIRARRKIWIPFIRSLAEKSVENNVILVGHSSGAQAILRYTEHYRVKAAVLVSATYSDLGDVGERESGYYPQPSSQGEEVNRYDFEAMKANCPIWHQFHSDDDPFIPLHEAERIRDNLGLKGSDNYKMLPGNSHFFEPCKELFELVEFLATSS